MPAEQRAKRGAAIAATLKMTTQKQKRDDDDDDDNGGEDDHEVVKPTVKKARKEREDKAAKKDEEDEDDDGDDENDDDDDDDDEAEESSHHHFVKNQTANGKKATAAGAKNSKQKAPAATASANNAAGGATTTTNAILDVILSHPRQIKAAATRWIAAYRQNKDAALVELINSILAACKCTGTINTHDLDDSASAVESLMAHFEDNAESYILPSTAKQSKQSRSFAKNLTDFWHELVAQISVDIIYDKVFSDTFLQWLTVISASGNRNFRHIATLIGLTITSAVVSIAAGLNKTLEIAQRQKSAKLVDETQEKQVALSNVIHAKLLNGIFVHRYRDSFEDIRAMCIAHLGRWILDYRSEFLSDGFLKYIGWSLSDKKDIVRSAALSALLKIYSERNCIALMEAFTDRFTDRIAELCMDISAECSQIGFKVASLLNQNALLNEKTKFQICNLLADEVVTKSPANIATLSAFISETYKYVVDNDANFAGLANKSAAFVKFVVTVFHAHPNECMILAVHHLHQTIAEINDTADIIAMLEEIKNSNDDSTVPFSETEEEVIVTLLCQSVIQSRDKEAARLFYSYIPSLLATYGTEKNDLLVGQILDVIPHLDLSAVATADVSNNNNNSKKKNKNKSKKKGGRRAKRSDDDDDEDDNDDDDDDGADAGGGAGGGDATGLHIMNSLVAMHERHTSVAILKKIATAIAHFAHANAGSADGQILLEKFAGGLKTALSAVEVTMMSHHTDDTLAAEATLYKVLNMQLSSSKVTETFDCYIPAQHLLRNFCEDDRPYVSATAAALSFQIMWWDFQTKLVDDGANKMSNDTAVDRRDEILRFATVLLEKTSAEMSLQSAVLRCLVDGLFVLMDPSVMNSNGRKAAVLEAVPDSLTAAVFTFLDSAISDWDDLGDDKAGMNLFSLVLEPCLRYGPFQPNVYPKILGHMQGHSKDVTEQIRRVWQLLRASKEENMRYSPWQLILLTLQQAHVASQNPLTWKGKNAAGTDIEKPTKQQKEDEKMDADNNLNLAALALRFAQSFINVTHEKPLLELLQIITNGIEFALQNYKERVSFLHHGLIPFVLKLGQTQADAILKQFMLKVKGLECQSWRIPVEFQAMLERSAKGLKPTAPASWNPYVDGVANNNPTPTKIAAARKATNNNNNKRKSPAKKIRRQPLKGFVAPLDVMKNNGDDDDDDDEGEEEEEEEVEEEEKAVRTRPQRQQPRQKMVLKKRNDDDDNDDANEDGEEDGIEDDGAGHAEKVDDIEDSDNDKFSGKKRQAEGEAQQPQPTFGFGKKQRVYV